jgi:hypothetical protein
MKITLFVVRLEMAPPSIPLLFHLAFTCHKEKIKITREGKGGSHFCSGGAIKVQPIPMTVKKMFSLLY